MTNRKSSFIICEEERDMNKLANIILITIFFLAGCEPKVDLSIFTGDSYTGWEDISSENDTTNGNEIIKDNDTKGKDDILGDDKDDKDFKDDIVNDKEDSNQEIVVPEVEPEKKVFQFNRNSVEKIVTLAYVLPESPLNDLLLDTDGNVIANSSFSLSASKFSRGVDLSQNSSKSNNSIENQQITKEIEFDNYLRNLENEFLSQSQTLRSRTVSEIKKSKPVEVGDKRDFYVLIDGKDVLTPAECIFTTEDVAFFQNPNYPRVSDQRIARLKEVAENRIPLIREKFSHEEDIDGNGQTFFFLTPLDGCIGYFYSADRYTQEQMGMNYKSNECEILYLNYDYLNEEKFSEGKYEVEIERTMVHEFQHLLLFDHRLRKNLRGVPTWFNEGLSMLSEYLAGFGRAHYEYIRLAIESRGSISLIEHPASWTHYGYALLFARYLQERFGEGFIKKFYDSQHYGIYGICDAVGVSNFNDLFADFMQMLLVTGHGVTTDSKYNIANFNHNSGSDDFYKSGFNIQSFVNYNCRNWYEVSISRDNMKPYSFYIASWWNYENSYISSINAELNDIELLVRAY